MSFQEITENNRWLVAEIDGHFFLAGDNGIISMIRSEIEISRVIEINLKQEVSLFPSCDLRAKSTCHIARVIGI